MRKTRGKRAATNFRRKPRSPAKPRSIRQTASNPSAATPASTELLRGFLSSPTLVPATFAEHDCFEGVFPELMTPASVPSPVSASSPPASLPPPLKPSTYASESQQQEVDTASSLQQCLIAPSAGDHLAEHASSCSTGAWHGDDVMAEPPSPLAMFDADHGHKYVDMMEWIC